MKKGRYIISVLLIYLISSINFEINLHKSSIVGQYYLKCITTQHLQQAQQYNSIGIVHPNYVIRGVSLTYNRESGTYQVRDSLKLDWSSNNQGVIITIKNIKTEDI